MADKLDTENRAQAIKYLEASVASRRASHGADDPVVKRKEKELAALKAKADIQSPK